MITFKQFITEARMAPLYHATSIDNAYSIITDNALMSSTDHENYRTQRAGKPSVFFTRNLKNAKTYGYGVHDDIVIFELDQQRLSYNYSIQPVHNWSDEYYEYMSKPSRKIKGELKTTAYGVEFEEVVGKDIRKFLSYVKTIYYDTPTVESFKKLMSKNVIDILNKYPQIQYKKVP